MGPLIGIVGDYNPGYEVHRATDEALASVSGALPFEWLPTDQVGDGSPLARYSAVLISPGSPYRDMEGALQAVRYARERGVPLVGT